MARITRDSSVLNQFGSPSLNSNSFANRPAFGQTGRLFIDTTNNIIQRDTGSSWVTISGGGSTPNLEQVTTVGKRSTIGIFLGPDAITPSDRILDVYGTTLLHNLTNGAANLPPLQYNQNAINYIGGTVSGFCNSLFAQDVYNVSANTNISASTQTGTTLSINTYKFTSASTLTLTQVGGLRTASALTVYSQFQNTAAGTITHTAGIAILGIEGLGGSALSIDNHYQLLINSSTEFANAPTIPANNRWGIYQAGSNDRNYFAGQSIFNDRVDFNSLIVVGASIYCSGTVTNLICGNTTNLTIYNNGITTVLGTIFTSGSGNWRIGTGTDSGDKLQVNGNTFTNSLSIAGGLQAGFVLDVTGQTVFRNSTYISGGALFINTTGTTIYLTTPVSTGVHTTSGNHLPISINGTIYWIALLNPPVIP